MRITSTLIIAAMVSAVPMLPAEARAKQSYEYNGKRYQTYAQCRAAKKRSETRGTVVGAATAGIGAALLGANLGESALIAGGGAVVGNVIGGKVKKC